MASVYEVEILNKWGEEGTYVDFLIHNRILGKTVHCCSWYDENENRTDIEIIEDIFNDGDKYFQLPKTSELSDVTYSIFEDLCQTDNDMLWIENEDDFAFYCLDKEENMQKLKSDVKKFHLKNCVKFNGNERITIYGDLQTLFDDNRETKEYKEEIKIRLISKEYVLEKFDLINRRNDSKHELVIFPSEGKFLSIDDSIGRCNAKVFDTVEEAARWLLYGKLPIEEYQKIENLNFIKNFIIDERNDLKVGDVCEL